MFGQNRRVAKKAVEPVEQELESQENYNKQAAIYYHKGQFQQAIEIYNKKKNRFNFKGTDLALFHHDCGSCYKKLGDYAKANENYTASIELLKEAKAKPNLIAYAYVNRGILYDCINRNDEAIDDYTQAISLDPKHAEAFFRRGGIHWDEKNWAKAISDFGNALAYSTADPAYHQRIKDERYRLFHAAFEDTTPAFLENFVMQPDNWKWTANQTPFEQEKSFLKAESNDWVQISKSQTMAAIEQLPTRVLQIEALFQFILPETMLGNLAYTKTSAKGFGLKPAINRGTLSHAASQLESLFEIADAKSLKEETRALLQVNVELQKGLAEHFPKLHKTLVDATVLLPIEKLQEQLKLEASAKALGEMKKGRPVEVKTSEPVTKETELQTNNATHLARIQTPSKNLVPRIRNG